jgi:hypothetical protein
VADDLRYHSASPARARSGRVRGYVWGAVVGLMLTGAADAAQPCYGLSPSVDGVLWLDAGRGYAWPCWRLRTDAAYDFYWPGVYSPGVIDLRSARPSRHGALRREPRATSRPVDGGAANDDAASKSLAQLKDENARLKDEASRLRNQTSRLKELLASRDATALGRLDDKIDGKINPSGSVSDTAPVPQAAGKSDKSDLLTPAPQTSEIQKVSPEQQNEVQLSDEQAFERQKSVVERAWKQLIDLAARMKQDLSSKPETGKPE